jgi:hypothetical protein
MIFASGHPSWYANVKHFSLFTKVYIMEMLTTLFRAKLTTGLADFGLQQML